MKKIVVATVRRVPSAFSDDETADELLPTSFSSSLWCDLRFNVHRSCTPGFENEFVDVETFLDDVLQVQEPPTSSAAAVDAKANPSQPSSPADRASPKFDKDLEWMLMVLTTKFRPSKPRVREDFTTSFVHIFYTKKVPRVVLQFLWTCTHLGGKRDQCAT
jgi:hypothetical protein